MIQTQDYGKKALFGPDLGPLGPNSKKNFVSFTSTSSYTLFQTVILSI